MSIQMRYFVYTCSCLNLHNEEVHDVKKDVIIKVIALSFIIVVMEKIHIFVCARILF